MRGGAINSKEKLGIGESKVRRVEAGGKEWVEATELAEKSVGTIIKEAGYHGIPLIALRRATTAGGKAGRATYGTWLVK